MFIEKKKAVKSVERKASVVEECCVLGNMTAEDPQIYKAYPGMQPGPKFQDRPRKATDFRVLRKLNTQQNGVLQLKCSRARALI